MSLDFFDTTHPEDPPTPLLCIHDIDTRMPCSACREICRIAAGRLIILTSEIAAIASHHANAS